MKFKRESASDRWGWTDVIFPIRNYKMACCDCGLVHDVRMEVYAIEGSARGTFMVKGKQSRREFRVGMKVRRNNRSTAQMRRAR